jgi:hypothetical protein
MKPELLLAASLDRLVSLHRMPHHFATDLLSSALLYLTGQCDLESHINAVAHIRLTMDPDYQDATAALAGWLDVANEVLKVQPATAPTGRHRCAIDMPPCPECQELYDQEDWREYGNP